jgi:hypothetical protein
MARTALLFAVAAMLCECCLICSNACLWWYVEPLAAPTIWMHPAALPMQHSLLVLWALLTVMRGGVLFACTFLCVI